MHPQTGAVGHNGWWCSHGSRILANSVCRSFGPKSCVLLDGRPYGLLPQLLPLGRRWRESQTPRNSRKRSSQMKSSAWQLLALKLMVTAVTCIPLLCARARRGSQLFIACGLHAMLVKLGRVILTQRSYMNGQLSSGKTCMRIEGSAALAGTSCRRMCGQTWSSRMERARGSTTRMAGSTWTSRRGLQ